MDMYDKQIIYKDSGMVIVKSCVTKTLKYKSNVLIWNPKPNVASIYLINNKIKLMFSPKFH